MKNRATSRQAGLLAGTTAAIIVFLAPHVSAAQGDADITLHNRFVTIRSHKATGAIDIEWQDGNKLLGLNSSALLDDGRTLSTSAYTSHQLDKPTRSAKPSAEHEYTIRNTAPGLPDLLQHIWLHDATGSIDLQAELIAKTGSLGTRHFDTLILAGQNSIQTGPAKDLRLLHVPFDNDMWFRYNSESVAEMKPSQLVTSNEVTAIYDNASRRALILGSISHDTWKTAIEAHAKDGQLTDLAIYGGITSPTGVRTDTHDTVPHGIVRGPHVLSPRIFIGSFSDWRDGLEAYGAANAAVHPSLKWVEGAPMGWNSWAAYADKINAHRYLDSAAFVRDKLVPEGFGRNKVVYVNLDAFWSNLDAVQLSDAVRTIKDMHSADGTHFEPGIYWTPFAYWSSDLDAYVEGTNMKYHYRDILLKAPDGSILPKVDGGLAIDPSHPGSRERATYFLAQFQHLGFKYLKLDFLSHGALEGVHFDPAIQTGTQAYNEGMKQIVDETANRIFLSLSIAPLFPSGYGHARRLSCDTKGHISGGDQTTEYMLNSLTYGWWTDKNLYITDPDHVVLGDAADQGARSIAEGKSRLLSAVISGGMILDSSRLADDPQGREMAQAVYSERAWLKVAAEGKIFHPVEGNTGDKGADIFTRSTDHGAYVALFNYDDKHPQTLSISLSRILQTLPTTSVAVIDVSTGATLKPAQGDLKLDLLPSASTLVELRWK